MGLSDPVWAQRGWGEAKACPAGDPGLLCGMTAVTLHQRSPKSSPKGYSSADRWDAQGPHLPLAASGHVGSTMLSERHRDSRWDRRDRLRALGGEKGPLLFAKEPVHTPGQGSSPAAAADPSLPSPQRRGGPT